MSLDMQSLLAIDLGTSSVKVLLTTEDGRFLAQATADYPLNHPQPNHVEQHPEDWWQAVKTAVHQIISQAPATTIIAIGLAGQMHGTVLLDKQNQLLAPAIIWPDQRSHEQVRHITQSIGAAQLMTISGSPIATGFQAASLLWLRQHHPQLWSQIHMVLLPKDYVRWRLTGQFDTDPSDASGTLLFNIAKGDWSERLLAVVGLERRQLPPVRPETAVAGSLTATAAANLGLPADIPVIIGAADTACGLLGAGVVDSQTLLINLSTGGQLVIPSHQAVADPNGRLHTFCSTSPQYRWYHMAAILSAGLALRWLRDQLFDLATEPNAYARMSSWASSVPPGANGLLCLPYLVGERTPHMNPAARGLFLGLTARHGRAEFVRAVMEGVALACYDATSIMHSVGANPQRLVIAGGGSKSDIWCQIIADVFNLPVQQLVVTEQSAVGAILLAGQGIGRFDLVTTAQQWAEYRSPLLPDPQAHATYQTLLPIFRAAYHKHQSDFDTLNHL